MTLLDSRVDEGEKFVTELKALAEKTERDWRSGRLNDERALAVLEANKAAVKAWLDEPAALPSEVADSLLDHAAPGDFAVLHAVVQGYEEEDARLIAAGLCPVTRGDHVVDPPDPSVGSFEAICLECEVTL